MFPQGTVWQTFRQEALSTFPLGSFASYANPSSFHDWLRRGAFTVTAATQKRILVEAAAADMGAVMMTEAAVLLDHALEHVIHLRHQFASSRWSSPAWSLVTVYYWAYFNALALTRMLGETAWFLSVNEARLLGGLAPQPVSVGPGPRVVTCGTQTTAAMRQITFRRPTATRAHDLVWRLWFERLRTTVPRPGTLGSGAPETRLYWPQVESANRLGDNWPSDLRNLVNYVPGLAYRATRGASPISLVSVVRADQSLSDTEAIERLESDVASLSTRPLMEQLPTAARTLLDIASVLERIASTLFADVADRRGIDRRWMNARTRLLAAQYGPYATRDWPIADAA